jgi:G1/S-specific cyclin PLC2
MSDSEALKIFSQQRVNSQMISLLVATTNSIIQVRTPPVNYTALPGTKALIAPKSKIVSLHGFINNLIKYSNVQTPTLMATLIYLNRLRNILPANAVGMETTRHRIFLSSLILAAKSLNDSSPLNKHWTKYTDGLLSLKDVNLAERELIALLKWNITINEKELVTALQPFLSSIKQRLREKANDESQRKYNFYRLSNAYSNNNMAASASASASSSSSSLEIPSSSYSLHSSALEVSSSSISSYASTLSLATSPYPSISEDDEDDDIAQFTMNHPTRKPLAPKSSNTLNLPSRNIKVKNHYNSYRSSGVSVRT